MADGPDQDLLNDLRARKAEACAEVVRRHYLAVYRFLLHLTRRVPEAEDLTQETFAAAWQKIGSYSGRAALGTWLHRIAYHKFLDARRSAGRSASHMARLRRESIAPDGDPFPGLADDDESRHLVAMLQRLDAGDRAVLVLHYLEGMSYRDMAQVLDEPVGTVKWRTSEAIERLRGLLAPEGSNHGTREPT